MVGVTRTSARNDGEVKTLYYRDNSGVLMRSDEYKTVSEMEELLGIIALKVSYSRYDLMGMYVHEFQAMISGLKKIHAE